MGVWSSEEQLGLKIQFEDSQHTAIRKRQNYLENKWVRDKKTGLQKVNKCVYKTWKQNVCGIFLFW